MSIYDRFAHLGLEEENRRLKALLGAKQKIIRDLGERLKHYISIEDLIDTPYFELYFSRMVSGSKIEKFINESKGDDRISFSASLDEYDNFVGITLKKLI